MSLEQEETNRADSPASFTTAHEEQEEMQHPRASLPGLPSELLTHILSHLIAAQPYPTRKQPPFLLLNRSIRLSTLSHWYATNTFYFAKPRSAQPHESQREIRKAFIAAWVRLVGPSYARLITKVHFVVRKDLYHAADAYDNFGQRNSSVGLTLTRTTTTTTTTRRRRQWKASWDRNNIDPYDTDVMEKQLEWMEEERQEGEERTELELLAERVPSLVQAHINAWQARQKRDWSTR